MDCFSADDMPCMYEGARRHLWKARMLDCKAWLVQSIDVLTISVGVYGTKSIALRVAM